MQRTLLSPRFRNVVFPLQRRRKLPLNLMAAQDAPAETREEPRFSGEQAVLIDWLFARAGLDPRSYRRETLIRRLPACLRLLRSASASHARRLLEENPGLISPAMSVMLVGVTSFFRDPDVFEWLAREALPRREGSRPGLYVWSAGCSDGAELYSLALQLAENGRLRDCYLLGSDCRSDAIERARTGVYDGEAIKGIPAELGERYFEPEGGRRRIKAFIRRQTRWAVSDLLKSIEPGIWDLILLRNIAMYFRAEAVAELWNRIESAMRPGALLVLGRAERPLGARRLQPVRPCVFRRSGG
jgi:chemotaxis methyl-accepting protein methylase